MKNYTQLNQENRCDIFGLKKANKSMREIAKEIEIKINSRPRKMLNFESPIKVFSAECCKLGIIC